MRRQDDGQISVLIVLLVVSLGLGIGAVIDIAGAYLRRQDATSLADGAALSASDAAAAVSVYGATDDDYVAIDEPAARDAVDTYLRAVDAYAAYPGLQVDVSVIDARVTVALSVRYELPVHIPGVDATTTIHADSTATMPIY